MRVNSKGGVFEHITVRVPIDIFNKFKNQAKHERRSLNSMIILALEAILPELNEVTNL